MIEGHRARQSSHHRQTQDLRRAIVTRFVFFHSDATVLLHKKCENAKLWQNANGKLEPQTFLAEELKAVSANY